MIKNQNKKIKRERDEILIRYRSILENIHTTLLNNLQDGHEELLLNNLSGYQSIIIIAKNNVKKNKYLSTKLTTEQELTIKKMLNNENLSIVLFKTDFIYKGEKYLLVFTIQKNVFNASIYHFSVMPKKSCCTII